LTAKRTAFDAALSEGDDARAFWDHRTDQLLGRRGSETLRLKTDERGLQYEIDLPDTGAGRDLAVLVERGDEEITKEKEEGYHHWG
jgi:HK97 family phage prohead protease